MFEIKKIAIKNNERKPSWQISKIVNCYFFHLDWYYLQPKYLVALDTSCLSRKILSVILNCQNVDYSLR